MDVQLDSTAVQYYEALPTSKAGLINSIRYF